VVVLKDVDVVVRVCGTRSDDGKDGLDFGAVIKLERVEVKGDCTFTFWNARHDGLVTATEATKMVVHFIVG
jgi:hypothetical protein